MNYIAKFLGNFKDFYNDINAATLTGAIDAIVVQQPDGTFICSPFHVRFGKLGVLRSKEKVVDIEINGEPVEIQMKLGENGEAFFVEEIEEDDENYPHHLVTSPIPSIEDSRNESNTGESTIVQSESDNKSSDSDRARDSSSATELDGPQAEDAVTPTPKTFAPVEGMPSLVIDFQPIDKQESVATQTDLPSGTKDKLKLGGDSSRDGSRRKKRKRATILKNKYKDDVKKDEPQEVMFPMEDIQPLPHSSSLPTMEQHNYQSLGPMFHPFSDTDLSPVGSPRASRPGTPVKSDTEYEMERNEVGSQTDKEWNWTWGEFPTPPLSEQAGDQLRQNSEEAKRQEEEERSTLGGMFSFMRRTKKMRHRPEEIYLEDLDPEDLDPEVAALYFPKSYKKSAEYNAAARRRDGKFVGRRMARLRAAARDEDCESGNGPSLPQSPVSSRHIDSDFEEPRDFGYDNLAVSLCGCMAENETLPEELFLQYLVSYEEFVSNPALLSSPDLVVRLGNQYYNWETGQAMLMSVLLYNRKLPQDKITELQNKHSKQSQDKKNNSSSSNNNNNNSSSSGSYSRWFMWRRNTEEKKPVVEPEVTKQEKPVLQKSETAPGTLNDTTGSLPPSPSERVRHTTESSDADELTVQYKKTLRLTSDQLESLNLQDGSNEAVFSVTTAYQGTTRCKCNIYLWKHSDKIIISDIDGTITKSDVLGHILPIIGMDWAQSGITELFTNISHNGYQFLYLSARAIGQAQVTREYLRSIKQDDLSLPDGPLLLSPSSLFNALHREVIEKKPEAFKIPCLKDIQDLFPSDSKPFYAGYGNRVNDSLAYKAVGIPTSRIFTINPKGELRHEVTHTFQSSYPDLVSLVEFVFPPLVEPKAQEQFNTFMYWREPLLALEDNVSQHVPITA